MVMPKTFHRLISKEIIREQAKTGFVKNLFTHANHTIFVYDHFMFYMSMF